MSRYFDEIDIQLLRQEVDRLRDRHNKFHAALVKAREKCMNPTAVWEIITEALTEDYQMVMGNESRDT